MCQRGCVLAPDGNEQREGLYQRATGKAHQRVEGCWAGKGRSRSLGLLKGVL